MFYITIYKWFTWTLFIALATNALADNRPILFKDIPNELKHFIQPQTQLIAFNLSDLNDDGLTDYLIILEKNKPADSNTEKGQRRLLLLIRQKNGSLKIIKTNEKIILCSNCGGVLGDPFESIETQQTKFTINHHGGSAWRWHTAYQFNYSHLDHSWQLIRAEQTSLNVGNPEETAEIKIYTPPRDYGKIDIADFNPDDFLGKGAK